MQTNRSECNALVKSYMECAQYAVVKEAPASSFLADQVGNSFNQFLTDGILSNLMQKCLQVFRYEGRKDLSSPFSTKTYVLGTQKNHLNEADKKRISILN